MTAILIYIAKSTENKPLIMIVGIIGIIFSCYMLLSPNIDVTSCFDVVQSSVISGNTTTNINAVICDTQTYGTTLYLAIIWLIINVVFIFDSISQRED